MSGITPIPIAEFRRLLRARGSSIESLAAEVGAARNTLWRVLRESGPDDLRKRVRACVTAAEWAHLIRMEHWATWNNRQRAHGPQAQVRLMRRQCADCRTWEGFTACIEAHAGEVTHGLCPRCYAATMAILATLGPDESEPAPSPVRGYLVMTDAGLMPHRSASRPAAATDRELVDAFVHGDAARAPIVCAAKFHSPRFNHEPVSQLPDRDADA